MGITCETTPREPDALMVPRNILIDTEGEGGDLPEIMSDFCSSVESLVIGELNLDSEIPLSIKYCLTAFALFFDNCKLKLSSPVLSV